MVFLKVFFLCYNQVGYNMKKNLKRLLIILALLVYVGGSYAYNDYTLPNDINKISLPALEDEEFSLTSEDYVEDFLYAYDVLKDNYPYFEINKEVNGIDWLANKDQYVDYISKSTDDNDFLNRMDEVLGEINNSHTNILDRDFVIDVFVDYYSMPKNFWLHDQSKVLENENVRRRYKLDKASINEYLDKYYTDDSPSYNLQTNDNLKIRSIIDGDLAYIGIKSFANPNINFDEDLVRQAIFDFKDYKNLIIDIRGNGGGNTEYWQYLLLENLISRPYQVNNYLFIKDGNINRLLIDNGVIANPGVSEFLEKSSFDKATKDLLKDFDFYTLDTFSVYPSPDSVNFQGKIYLLVDDLVYSAAEAFASFCKESGLATLVGTRTAGDGLGYDPLIFSLPNTGFAMRYSETMGVTESGSINERDQTLPDIEVENGGQEVDLPFREQKTIRAVMEDAGLEFKN